MASFTEGGNDGVLAGITSVILISPPAASTRRVVKHITISNQDTAVVTLTVRKTHGVNVRVIWEGQLEPNYTWIFGDGDVLVLDDIDQSVTAVLSGAPATTQPDFTASWGDAT